MAGLRSTTIRDYSGGWNVSDSDMNLSSKFQPISDNIQRGLDGSFGPRMGIEMRYDFGQKSATEKGTSETRIVTGAVFATADTKPVVTITVPIGDWNTWTHITLVSISGGDINGIPQPALLGTHGIHVAAAGSDHIITFYVADHVANATSTATRDIEVIVDNFLLGGNIIHDHYFNRRLVVFTDIGEVGTADVNGNLACIWNAKLSNDREAGVPPTRRCKHWSSSSFKSTLIACNGYDKDKPIQIFDDFTVGFLEDKATNTNASVPRADFVVSLQKYVCFVRTEYGNAFIEMSAKGTDGTFTRETSPDDAVEIDLSIVTETVEPTLLGACQFRDRLYAAFYDRGMIGILGRYDSNNAHEPDFSDTISEHGTVSHRTLVSLGNDIFMCDYAGVPSVTISQSSGVHVPVRVSDLIAPAIQKHLSSLSEDTLRYRAFALYNRSDRSYMLFIPIYDEVTHTLPDDPMFFSDELREKNWVYIRAPRHKLFEDSHITIAGASDIGNLLAADINGKRRIVSVVDDNGIIVEIGGSPSNTEIVTGGGVGMTYTPVNDETIAYVFEYNREFKIRRWTRYRGCDFDCGTVSQRGKIFLCKGLRVYRLGDNEEPLYADYINEYDHFEWEHNVQYDEGIRVRDPADGLVYECLVSHTSASSGTFDDYRIANKDTWALFRGRPIKWALETPWSDMQQRDINKINIYIGLESEGTDYFTVSAFTNSLRRNPADNELMPARSLDFVAGDSGGWDEPSPGGWGGGRRTREEKLWPFSFRGKLIRWRYHGETREHVRIVSHTMYYKLGGKR